MAAILLIGYQLLDVFRITQGNPKLQKYIKDSALGSRLLDSWSLCTGARLRISSRGGGKGSEVLVQPPIICEVSVVDPQSAPNGEATTDVRLRVLVVGDNKSAADMLSMVVKTAGPQVDISAEAIVPRRHRRIIDRQEPPPIRLGGPGEFLSQECR